MKLSEKTQNLFEMEEDIYLAHCISADFVMGKGIASQFNRRFDLKAALKRAYPQYVRRWREEEIGGSCLPEGRVFSLVTKERWMQKPTYDSLRRALEQMRAQCEERGVRRLAMPRIACGLDGLEWARVRAMIEEVFGGTQMEITVCSL